MSKLSRLKNDWDSLAQRDALAAILTDGSKSGGKWDITEFMATGDEEIETVLRHLETIGLQPDRDGAVLDFGCGVGRLTQALARRFQSSVGIDISQEMITQANALNQYEHCRYVANATPQLPFADESFSFIYSNIVLQHVARSFAANYLREFTRVLAPGAVMVFGVQDSFAAPDLASTLTRFRHILHPRSRVRAWFKGSSGDMQMHCLPEQVVRQALGTAMIADIRHTNTAAKDFNGKLVYLEQPPRSGYVGRQYCVRKPELEISRGV
ncbi:class I SAM-dependent methyltransferase [Terriglobus saanensis]|uniref:Methyltransferase type 11 n=1 Tax=Terriglobus saanensis (strain ATCC BAA-1853 / DSM 23119 / SP1PR4) TaxID=401053 RepID=E8V2U8_TERSS|nr:class I SAM-dependent methyltransferase [Terriglobus saanensis]ADV84645.1 Methyltransferase type 11 [Terriglobus saanensis SP1PR4]